MKESERGTRRSEKAKVSDEALLTSSSKAKKPMNACVHTYTKPLFIGTQFSILYTFMYSSAEAATPRA